MGFPKTSAAGALATVTARAATTADKITFAFCGTESPKTLRQEFGAFRETPQDPTDLPHKGASREILPSWSIGR